MINYCGYAVVGDEQGYSASSYAGEGVGHDADSSDERRLQESGN